MSYTVIITSQKITNVKECIAAIEKHQPGTPIIVVADGIGAEVRAALPMVKVLDGEQPFSFSRNNNAGIREAGTDDVILLNDDALLHTPGGFDLLAAASPHYGVVAAAVNGRCHNRQQKVDARTTMRSEPLFLAFIAVYISRSTIDKVGLLDERFQTGTWEDNDFCRRAVMAGLALGIHGGCIVNHPEANKTFERLAAYQQILAENKKRYDAKYAPTRILLSVCVCSIFTRSHYLARLMACLSPQLVAGTEFLLAVDAGQESIGQKRQRLLESSRGEYHLSVDDDDLLAPDAIKRILMAINRNPKADAICYKSKRYENGVFEADCIYSTRYASNGGSSIQANGVKCYERWPYHVNPIKREHALKIGFPNKDHGEDTDFANRLRPLIQVEEFIDDYLYFYWWRSDRTGEQTHLLITQGR